MYLVNARNLVTDLLHKAGIDINGTHAWDPQVYNDDFFKKAVSEGSLGVGDSYVNNWWDCKRLDEFVCRVLQTRTDSKIEPRWKEWMNFLIHEIYNFQTPKKATHAGQFHYDLGHDVFEAMLDKNLIYSCAYWKNATDLESAQIDKMKLSCEKLMLHPGMHVLDVGCGWGGFARYATQHYNVEVTGITVSKDQAEFASRLCANLPVHILLQDYRSIEGRYDRIFSFGMLEHVGFKNYRTYMEQISSHLKNDGLFLLHTIGSNISSVSTDPWLNAHIFPESMLPSIAQIGKAIEGIFVMEDWHNFSAHYDQTLMAWYANFVNNWSRLKNNYDERFYRLWTYYLLSCAGSFRARKNQLWQIVLSKGGVGGGYNSIR